MGFSHEPWLGLRNAMDYNSPRMEIRRKTAKRISIPWLLDLPLRMRRYARVPFRYANACMRMRRYVVLTVGDGALPPGETGGSHGCSPNLLWARPRSALHIHTSGYSAVLPGPRCSGLSHWSVVLVPWSGVLVPRPTGLGARSSGLGPRSSVAGLRTLYLGARQVSRAQAVPREQIWTPVSQDRVHGGP